MSHERLSFNPARGSVPKPDCLYAQSHTELWDSVAPHLSRIMRRVWRRRVLHQTKESEETFVRNATRQLFESLTLPLRETAKVRGRLQDTVTVKGSASMPCVL